jgi:hypothetical protein
VAPTTHRSGPIKGSLERVPPRSRAHASLERVPPQGSRLSRAGSASLEGSSPPCSKTPSQERLLPHAGTGIQCSNTVEPRRHAPGNHAPALFRQLSRGSPSPPLQGAVRYGQCEPRGTVLPTPVRLTSRALEGGPAAPSKLFPRESAGSNHDVRPAGAPSPPLLVLCGRPRACSATPGTATTTPALLDTRGRDASTPATVPRTDHRQRLPRARLRASQPTTTPSPSKPPLFEYRTRHDEKTGEMTVRTAANSAALHAIPPHVAE